MRCKEAIQKGNIMPIYKYKTFEEAERSLWNFNPDEKYYDGVEELWALANELSSISYPEGIFKFGSIEEANKHREEIEIAHAKRLHAERGPVKKGDRPRLLRKNFAETA